MMKKVKYVGRKPSAVDNVAGSGRIWKGNGDIQTVTDRQALILSKYPDQWEIIEEAELGGGAGLSDLGGQTNPGNDGDDSNTDETDFSTKEILELDLESKTKDELQVFAKDHLNLELSEKLTKKQMIDEIEAYINRSDNE